MTSLLENNCYMGEQPKPNKPISREWVRPMWLIFNVGWYVALSLVVPTGLGWWLDQPDKYDTHPLFTLIGFGIGTVIAFYGLYHILRRFYIEQKRQEEDKGLK